MNAPCIQIGIKDIKKIDEDLTPEERLEIWDGITGFVLSGEIPEFEDRYLRSIFRDIVETIQSGQEQYQANREKKRRAAESRWNAQHSNAPDTTDKTADATQCNAMQCNATQSNAMQNMQNRIEMNRNELKGNEIKEIKKEKTAKIRKDDFIKQVEDWTQSPEEREAMLAFFDMRLAINKPLTNEGARLTMKKIDKLSSDPAERVEIINQSVQNSYQGIFPLRRERALPEYSGGIKKVQEQQYEQRQNTENTSSSIPDWLKEGLA